MKSITGILATLVAFAIFSVPSVAGASATPTRYIPASGGTIKWAVTIHNATTCRWVSSPEVVGFDGTIACANGRAIRPATFQVNTSTGTKTYALSLVVRGATRTVDHLKVVEAEAVLSPPPPPAPGHTSSSWSGYVLTGENGGYQGIGGEWTVPTLDCASTPNSWTADWVGVNGALSNPWMGASDIPGLFQDGTESGCLGGQQTDFAWWTDEAGNYFPVEVFTVAPGDVIYAEVWQDPTSGYWGYSVKDLTSSANVSAFPPTADAYSGAGLSAEWIAEDPGCPNDDTGCWNNNGELWDLPNFGTVTFTDLGLTTPLGSWTVPPYSDAYEMVAPDGSVEALPSQMTATGFTVAYEGAV